MESREKSKIAYKFKYTDGSSLTIVFPDKGSADKFANLEGDHLVEYEIIREYNGKTNSTS